MGGNFGIFGIEYGGGFLGGISGDGNYWKNYENNDSGSGGLFFNSFSTVLQFRSLCICGVQIIRQTM